MRAFITAVMLFFEQRLRCLITTADITRLDWAAGRPCSLAPTTCWCARTKSSIECNCRASPTITSSHAYELSQDLVPVSESDALKIAADLPDNRRYCRPWTRDFLQDFSEAFYEQFHTPSAGELAGSHRRAAAPAAPLEPLCGARVRRHRIDAPDRRHFRHVAPRPDLRAV